MISCNIGTRAQPLSGAVVKLFQTDGLGNEKQLEQLTTDANGQTPQISLPAPPLDYSLVPMSPMPYSQYDIMVEADGFEPMAVRDIQVLPETTALQDCILSPETIISQQNEKEIIIIDHHTLYYEYPEKIPESAVKDLPPPTGFVVLDRVVVPETIVVYDGKPDIPGAAKYYVPFRDYIKNVASSEIYANWPVNSIKANVLAILSFTLNRVFTEWYRGKGKDFTITSSTSFDQAYMHGRNIFTEISQVVDEIFTSFITKPDIRQPLFSQYCDGVRVKRDGWLSQWGSKDLAEKGYTTIDILRNYYGSNVYLDAAVKVAGIPQSYPGFVLKAGSTGDAVRTIQRQLNAISNNYPAIKKVAVDGVFGQSTTDAVKMFQSIFNLTQDGIVGFGTWYKISDIYVAIEKLAAAHFKGNAG